MTRKQALSQAIRALSQLEGYEEQVHKLKEIYDELPLIHWSDASIRDTVDQFILDNGRIPTATDFRKKGMPPHPVIKQKYGINLSEWLEQNYPTVKPNNDELREAYTKSFKEDYFRIKPRSSKQFNNNKSPETKGWQTVAQYHNVKSWRNLLKALDLPPYFDMRRDHTPREFKITVHNDYDFTD